MAALVALGLAAVWVLAMEGAEIAGEGRVPAAVADLPDARLPSVPEPAPLPSPRPAR